MKKTNRCVIISAIFLLSMTGCSDWNDHYESTGAEGTNATIWEEIVSNPELSDFAEVLQHTTFFRQHKKTEASYAEILNGGQSFTVMAPVNGTFNKDSLITLTQTAIGDSAVEHLFVKNHISRSPHSAIESTFRMMNNKKVLMSANNISGIDILQSNIHAKNGILHIIGSEMPYNYTIFERLTMFPEFASVGKILSAYNEFEFDEDASVSSGMIDGIPIYVDSVLNERNRLLEKIGLLNSEDSAYYTSVPTLAGWDTIWNKVSPYYNYHNAMEKRDSLQAYWTTRALLEDAIFSRTTQPDESKEIRSVQYDPTEPEYHIFYKPFEPDGLFGSAKNQISCSNGTIFTYDEWPFKLTETFFKKIEQEGEQEARVISYEKCTYNTRSLNADSISDGGYMEIIPSTGTSNWTITYKLSNTLAGKYDFCIITLPKTIEDPTAKVRPYRFKATINYIDQDGNPAKYDCGGKTFNSNASLVDTIVVAEGFQLPTCNFDQTNDKFSITLQCNITAKENTKYDRRMYLDCILLRPRE